MDGNLSEYFRKTVLKVSENHKIRNRCVQLRRITSNYYYSPYRINYINIKVKPELIITKYEIINCNEILCYVHIYIYIYIYIYTGKNMQENT